LRFLVKLVDLTEIAGSSPAKTKRGRADALLVMNIVMVFLQHCLANKDQK